MKLIARFVRETEGQDLIEYALLAAVIGLGTTLAMTTLSGQISTGFDNVNTAFTSAAS
jgi:pilus assembly protein Flp/PilA